MEELKKYTTIDLVNELLTRSNIELEYSLLTLLVERKIDFVTLSNQYTKALERWHDDDLNKLIEAEQCVLESFSYSKNPKVNDNKKHIKRCLYLLNKSNRYMLNKLNDKYSYNEEDAKQYSVYERNKNLDK